MLTAESAFALFFMLALASITYYVAQRIRAPYTVLLVLVGVFLAVISSFKPFESIREFHLTPELLFFIFLPTLLFETAFNMNVRRVVDDFAVIFLLAVPALFISALLIGAGLWFAFALIGFQIPFLATLLFGALISATDPVAVLALFKEYGAPRRLTLIFEGESIANDATALALVLVVLGLFTTGVSAGSLALGGAMFTTMLIGGIALGLAIGTGFILLIGLFRENEMVAITLMLVLAHLTFLIAETANHMTREWGFSALQFSPIIATTVAALLMGNYGRFRVSPRAEEFVEKFWAQFAFMANSVVFILVGFFFASLPEGAGALIIPSIVAVFVVAAARALSIYGTIIPFNLLAKPELRVPTSWQHLLSWGSLRGALAIMLVLLIPENLAIAGWNSPLSVRDTLLVITVTCIFATLFIKATTIGLFIKRLKIDALHPLEESAETEGKAIIHGMTVMRLREFAEKGYIPHGIVEQLIENHERKFKESVARTNADNNDRIAALTERVLNLYVLGLEREKLKELFTYGEMTEHVFRRIYGKLTIQAEAIERGDTPDEHVTRDARDIFENAAEFALKFLKRETAEKTAEEQILYYRAQSILAWKVVKELHKLEKEFESPIFTAERLGHTLATYERYRREAREKADAIRTRFPEIAQKLDKRLALRSTLRVEKKQLERLYRRGLLTPKLYIKLNEEYEREAGKLTGS